MKRLKLLTATALLLIFFSSCSAQRSTKDWMSYYKDEFVFACTQPFVIDTGWIDDVCAWTVNPLDKRSYLEIDSMSALIEELIWSDFDKTCGLPREYNSAYPGRDCVLKFCLDQYESKDMDKIAKRAAKRIKRMTPLEVFESNQ